MKKDTIEIEISVFDKTRGIMKKETFFIGNNPNFMFPETGVYIELETLRFFRSKLLQKLETGFNIFFEAILTETKEDEKSKELLEMYLKRLHKADIEKKIRKKQDDIEVLKEKLK